jgi:hypothetical protein
MENSYTRHQELLFKYGERISQAGIDRLEHQLQVMKKRDEKWGNDFSLCLAQEIKGRGHDIDYDNYKILYNNEKKNTKRA